MRCHPLRRFVVSVWFCALFFGAAGLCLLTEGLYTGAEAAMGEPCADCHEGMEVYLNSFHSKIWQGEHDCQDCHGQVDQHMGDPSPKTIFSFGKDSGRSAEEMSAVCLTCHASSTHLTYWDMGAHKKNDVACVSCHTIHAQRSTVKQPTVCFGCHQDVRSDANKQSHHPIIEGKVKCSDCHNTHGTLSKHMINAESTNQLCYTCHADKRGPWIWEHPPVEEDCAICHTPHGSRHETLLTERMVTLCQDCHDDRSHHGNAYDNTRGFDGTPLAYVVNRQCLQCHHAIHGSANFKRSLSR